MIEAVIYLDAGVFVVDFTSTDKRKLCIVHKCTVENGELTIEFIRRVFGKISHNDAFDYMLSEVNPFSEEHIERAFPEFVESIGGYWDKKKYLFGLIVREKWIPEVKRLKEGWVEFKPLPKKEVITTKYRIIKPV
jgi:hypothetical protein